MSPHEILKNKWHPVAEKNAIPLREGRRVACGGYEIALFNLGDEYLAVDNRCPHKSGPLADGIVSGKAVFCPLHNWKINLENGCALSGGTGQVKKYPVKVVGEKVYVDFENGKLYPSQQNQTMDTTGSVEID